MGDPSSQLNWSLGARLPKSLEAGVSTRLEDFTSIITRETRTAPIVNVCIVGGPCVAN